MGTVANRIQRPAARAQEEHLDCRGDATIVAEAVANGRDVVLAQREGLPNVVLGQPARQVLDSDEALGIEHGGRPGSKAKSTPVEPLAQERPVEGARDARGTPAQVTVSICRKDTITPWPRSTRPRTNNRSDL